MKDMWAIIWWAFFLGNLGFGIVGNYGFSGRINLAVAIFMVATNCYARVTL